MKKDFSRQATPPAPVALGLALQGGGAYGAFTKGVLKALLESDLVRDGKIDIKAVTGTSAGAMNGLMLVDGLNTGGPAQAIKNLDALWHDAGLDMQRVKKLAPGFRILAAATWPNLPESVMRLSFSMMPKGYIAGRLKELLNKHVTNWDAVQNGPVKLFINAVTEDPKTKERKQRIFSGRDLTPDAFAAAGALDALGAHTIDGVDHYDGGYWRNPCFDDVEKAPITDLLVITIMEMPDHAIAPQTQDSLRDQHARPGHEVMKWEPHHHLAWLHENNKNLNLHVVGLNVDKAWNDTSRMNTDPRWLAQLEKMGYEAGQDWLRKHAHTLGKSSSYAPPCHKAPLDACACKPAPKCPK